MASEGFRFDRYRLDPRERALYRDDEAVDLNARYLDALILMVRQPGKLVTKAHFHQEVWRGAPVTDEALTQCIRTLRRQLGDDAGAPRFIETVPKYGYRFIAPVAAPSGPQDARSVAEARPSAWRQALTGGVAGMAGGGVAGLVGGLAYGLADIAGPGGDALGAASVLTVLIALTVAMGLLGGAGVGAGVALGRALIPERRGWSGLVGGAAGGLLVGAMVKLIGLDVFALLFGQTPGDITGAPEGALLGAAIGGAVWLTRPDGRRAPIRRGLLIGGLVTAASGVLIVLMGGRLMGGSLALLAERFPQSRLRPDHIGALLGEPGFGPLASLVTAGVEGLLFGGGVVAALALAARWRAPVSPAE